MRRLFYLFPIFLVFLSSCEEKKELTIIPTKNSANSQESLLDSRVGIDSKKASPESSAKLSELDQPPENGILSDSAIERALPKMNSKVEMINEGSSPKLSLNFAFDPKKEIQTQVRIFLKSGGKPVLPPIDFDLILKAISSGQPTGVNSDSKLSVKVTNSNIVEGSTNKLPPEIISMISKFKGSDFQCTLRSDGSIGDCLSTKLKQLNQAQDAIVKALYNGISQYIIPSPTKPVGIGAVWMCTDKTTYFEIPVVRYRAWQVKQISAKEIKLELTIRQYTTKDEMELQLQDGKKTLQIGLFEGQGKAEIVMKTESRVPDVFNLQQDSKVLLIAGDGAKLIDQREMIFEVPTMKNIVK